MTKYVLEIFPWPLNISKELRKIMLNFEMRTKMLINRVSIKNVYIQ